MLNRSLTPTNETHPPAYGARGLLQVWLSPSFPIGSYAYSHGLEMAVERRWVSDPVSLEAWLHDLLKHGSLRNDLILLAVGYATTDDMALRDLADLSAALHPSAERALEATQQGSSFLQQIDAAWPVRGAPLRAIFAETTPSFPVALGAASRCHGLPLSDALVAYAIAFTSNLISAAIRLGVVGQTDGQRVLAALMPSLSEVAQTQQATLDDLGGGAFRSDIASMQHETQYTRLFRS